MLLAVATAAKIFFFGMIALGPNPSGNEIMTILVNATHSDSGAHSTVLEHKPIIAFDCEGTVKTAKATRDSKGVIAVDAQESVTQCSIFPRADADHVEHGEDR